MYQKRRKNGDNGRENQGKRENVRAVAKCPAQFSNIQLLCLFATAVRVGRTLSPNGTHSCNAKLRRQRILENWAGHFVTALGVAGLEDYNVRGVVM